MGVRRAGQMAELPQRVPTGRHVPDGNKIQRPETLAGCECKANVEARQVWIMGKQCGLVLDVRDLQVKLGTGGGSCPF